MSNSPSVSATGLYLVVTDVCGDVSWHADILASSMSDQNIANSITGTAIPAANLKLQNSGTLFYLDTTPSNPEVVASTINTDTSFSTALQLIARTVA